MFGKWKLEQPVVIGVLLALCVAAVYLPAVFLDFTNYDDTYYVTENPHIRAGLSWATIGWAMTHSCVGHWQPVTLMSHALDCQIYGLSPAGHHLTSVILHGANTIVLFLLLRSLTGATWRSAAVAALFALHPLRVESVAWVSERKDVLSAFFGLLSLLAWVGYIKSVEERRPSVEGGGLNGESGDPEQALGVRRASARSYYMVALGLFALGLMSKAILVTWPFVMLLLDFWPLNRLEKASHERFSVLRFRGLIQEKFPFFVLAGVSCITTFWAAKASGGMAPLGDIPMMTRLLNALLAYVRYIGMSIWPVNLAPIYPYVQYWPVWTILAALLLLATITGLVIWRRERQPYLVTGWAWYLGTLVPVIGLAQAGNQSIADRYTYNSTIGLLIMSVWMMADLASRHRWRQITAIAAATAGLAASATLTQKQLMYWQNTETLFRHTLEVTDDNFIAWNSLAFYFADHRESRQAEQYVRTALRISPHNFYSLEKLGSVLIDQGRYDEAELNARKALEVNPQMAAAHRTLGLALMKQGKTSEAIAEYQESLRLEPDHAPTHYNLANALAKLGQFTQAGNEYQKAVRLDPTLADAHNNLGYMLVREGKLIEAASEFRAALALKPDSWHARYGLGDALARLGKTSEAADEFLKVLQNQPALTIAQLQLNRMAWILASNPQSQFRDGIKAMELAQHLCELTSHTNATMLETLAVAQAKAGQFNAAINSVERARKLAVDAGQKDVAQKADELAELFRAGQPYRETATVPR
jgi:tetratricopeptide (TPR) repeat protein